MLRTIKESEWGGEEGRPVPPRCQALGPFVRVLLYGSEAGGAELGFRPALADGIDGALCITVALVSHCCVALRATASSSFSCLLTSSAPHCHCQPHFSSIPNLPAYRRLSRCRFLLSCEQKENIQHWAVRPPTENGTHLSCTSTSCKWWAWQGSLLEHWASDPAHASTGGGSRVQDLSHRVSPETSTAVHAFLFFYSCVLHPLALFSVGENFVFQGE